MPERDAFEEWWEEEVRAAGNLSLTTQQVYLLEQCFRAGARSRDAEVEELREALRDCAHWIDSNYATPRREAKQRARAALGEEG